MKIRVLFLYIFSFFFLHPLTSAQTIYQVKEISLLNEDPITKTLISFSEPDTVCDMKVLFHFDTSSTLKSIEILSFAKCWFSDTILISEIENNFKTDFINNKSFINANSKMQKIPCIIKIQDEEQEYKILEVIYKEPNYYWGIRCSLKIS